MSSHNYPFAGKSTAYINCYLPQDSRRKCNRCGKDKQPEDFPIAKKYNTQAIDGLYHLCFDCTKLQDADELEIKMHKYDTGAEEFKDTFKNE